MNSLFRHRFVGLLVLGMIYKAVKIPDNIKPFIAAFAGIGLGILALYYEGQPPFTVAQWTDNILYGFMVGASAVGIWEMQKKTVPTKYNVIELETGNKLTADKVKVVKAK